MSKNGRQLQLFVNFKNNCNQERNVCLKTKDDINFEDVLSFVKNKLGIKGCYVWAFQYFDDEGDLVIGKSELEWKEAIENGSADGENNLLILHIELVQLGNAKNKKVKATCCKPSAEVSCCPSSAPSPAPSDQSCSTGFVRPVDEVPTRNGPPPSKVINPNSQDYKYVGEALRAVALPFGPIGGGSIALVGDGGLRQWQISNVIYHKAQVPDSFFGIRVDNGSESKSFVLQSSTWYDESGFVPENFVTDHCVPDESKELLSKLPGIKTLEVTAKYPTAKIDYVSLSDDVPVFVSMEAWNPCIPLDSKNSGLPVIVFNFTVTSTANEPIQVSLLGSLQNLVGWNGLSAITDEVKNAGYGGNVNYLLSQNDFTAVQMSNPTLDPKSISNGEVSIAAITNSGDGITTMLQYDNVKEMWEYFSGSGLPGQGQPGPSPSGCTWNGALSVKRTIQPQSTEVITFMLAWHFPHRYVNWSQDFLGISDDKSDFYIGNRYNAFWKNVHEVVNYTTGNYDYLEGTTKLFQSAMFDNTTVPWQVIDSAAGRISVIRSPVCMWLENGDFCCFEGCNWGDTSGGCCPLNCTHVCNYEMTLAKLWPDVERTMRVIDLEYQISPNSIIPSRSAVPLVLRREWHSWPNYTDISQSSTNICVDGEIGTVLKTYREVKQGAPNSWFNNIWPNVKKVMNRWMTVLDDGTGTVNGPQPNTYDCATYGVNTFIGTLYLAALRAAEEMAKLQGESDLAAQYHQRFEVGSSNLDKDCFVNGKWYTQKVDPDNPHYLIGDATFVDALLGQWWAHSLNLGYLLPEEHIKLTLQNIFTENHVDAFNPGDQHPRAFFDQRDSGLKVSHFEKTPASFIRYSFEGAWSGLEYSFGSLCLYEDLTDIGMKVLTDCRNKYDGTRRSPWNEVECGDHYVRPMAAFQLFETVSGQSVEFASYGSSDAIKLGFAPHLNPENFRGFFITGTGWGQFEQQGNSKLRIRTVKLYLAFGSINLAAIELVSTTQSVQAFIHDKETTKSIPVDIAEILTENRSPTSASLSISFRDGHQTMAAGQTLEIKF